MIQAEKSVFFCHYLFMLKIIYIFANKIINNSTMGLHKIKQERNMRLIADFKRITAENSGDTKGVVRSLAKEYNICTMSVYRILWDYEKKGGVL